MGRRCPTVRSSSGMSRSDNFCRGVPSSVLLLLLQGMLCSREETDKGARKQEENDTE